MSYCNRMCNSSSSALSDRWVPTDQEYKESQQALASCVPKRQLHDSCNVEIFGDMTVSFEACTKPSMCKRKQLILANVEIFPKMTVSFEG